MFLSVNWPETLGALNGAVAIIRTMAMREQADGLLNVVRFPRAVSDAPVDETMAQMISLLQDHLQSARDGKLRSVAVVSVSDDGASIATQWSCAHGDVSGIIGKLTVLIHDLVSARN
jgi:hypothetical protein